jgi:hypothetical protein
MEHLLRFFLKNAILERKKSCQTCETYLRVDNGPASCPNTRLDHDAPTAHWVDMLLAQCGTTCGKLENGLFFSRRHRAPTKQALSSSLSSARVFRRISSRTLLPFRRRRPPLPATQSSRHSDEADPDEGPRAPAHVPALQPRRRHPLLVREGPHPNRLVRRQRRPPRHLPRPQRRRLVLRRLPRLIATHHVLRRPDREALGGRHGPGALQLPVRRAG